MTATARTNKHKPQQDQAKSESSSLKQLSAGADPCDVTKPIQRSVLVAEHLPPVSMVCFVLLFSGSLFVLGIRDALATGRVLAGPFDAALQQFTDSTAFYDGSSWRAAQGGLSSIRSVTTDANNMGGLFVRKVGGAAAAVVHLQKLLPLLFHPEGAEWMAGHFRPLYGMAVMSNLALATFYGVYMRDLVDSGAAMLPIFIIGILVLESIVLLYHLIKKRGTPTRRPPAVAMPDGKTPESVTSRIVARTVAVVSTCMALIAARDLFMPGYILMIPRDDIYLEWTNALLHSPPQGSVEEEEQGLEAAMYIGDKFVSQFMALNMLILCAYKFYSAFFVKFGSDGSGLIKCKMIWHAQCIGDVFILLLLRLFSSAALTASLDLRWHLMLVAYEGFILGECFRLSPGFRLSSLTILCS
jgi:hypothetical protein